MGVLTGYLYPLVAIVALYYGIDFAVKQFKKWKQRHRAISIQETISFEGNNEDIAS